MMTARFAGLFVGVAAMALASSVAAETFTLRIGAGHPNGPTVYVNDMANFFVPEVKRRVAEETEHEIEFVEGYGGAIAGVADVFESVQSGLLDIGGFCMCFETSKLFLHNFPYYAPFGPQDSAQAMQTVRQVYNEVPWLTEAFEKDYGQVLLGLHGWDNYHLGTVEPWSTLEDLKGVKIAGAGPNLPWLETAGTVPVQSALPDGYMSMQTGVYSGWIMFPSGYLGFKFYEPAPNFTLIGFGAMGVNALTMNAASLSRLPEDVQAIIREVGAQYEAAAGANLNAAQERGLAGLKEAGANIVELAPEARQAWAETMADFPARMAADGDGRGMPASDVLKAYIAAVSAAGYTWPVDYKID